MPSLQDQLKEVQQEQANLKIKYPHYIRLENCLSSAEIIAGFISFLSIIGLCVWIYDVVTPVHDSTGIFLLFFYGGLFLLAILKEWLTQPIKYLINRQFKISKVQFAEFEAARSALISRKLRIEREIKEDEKQAKYRQESKFIDKLDNFVNALQNRKLPYNAALALKKNLEQEYEEIKKNGYQIHTRIYYNNRFIKIIQALNNYTSAPQPVAKTEVKEIDIKPEVVIPQEVKPVENRPIPKAHNPTDKIGPPKIIENKPVTNTEVQTTIPHVDGVKEISQLVTLPLEPKAPKQEDSKTFKPTAKTDFKVLNDKRHSIGELGEIYIFEKEKKKLKEKGLDRLSSQVQHISKHSDSYGYDIISFSDDGTTKYIEVKTTTGNINTPFHLTETELAAIKKIENYIIYRVYNFNVDKGEGITYTVNKSQLEKFYNLEPTSYNVNPKW